MIRGDEERLTYPSVVKTLFASVKNFLNTCVPFLININILSKILAQLSVYLRCMFSVAAKEETKIKAKMLINVHNA